MPTQDHAILLFAHGSPDPEWSGPAARVQDILAAKCPGTAVALAFLAPAKPDFSEVVTQLVAAGVKRITVAPMFLGRGGHLKRDLQEMLATATERHGVQIDVLPALGESDELLEAMASWIARQV